MDVGTKINQYIVVEHIGRGGMADVWSARDVRLNRTVAIKTIARDLAADVDPVELFEREAQTIAQLEHPHILPIYDFGDFENQLYIVMRYVTGGSLENLVADGPLPVTQTLRIGEAVATALDYAHEKNVIHLDIKPSNILLDSNQSPYLADFGLATVTDPEGRAANPGYGTLLYMAPEQLTAQELDYRADIYSFTILIYHLLTGELPFDATTSLALKQLQFQEDLPDMGTAAPGLPMELTPILRRGTALQPDMRPGSVLELIQQLQGVLAPHMIPEAAVEGGVLLIDTGGEVDDEIDEMMERTVSLENIKPLTPEELARQEAVDLYTRARRTWSHGQGRFLLGVTHFMLISDYYVKAEEYGLELDEAGKQMLLRGALEYDHEVDYWWSQLDDENRRWVALHAVRSDNAPARVRALYRLETLPDSDPPRIPGLVAQALQVEDTDPVKIAALRVLGTRAKLVSTDSRPSFGHLDGSLLTTRRRLLIQANTPSFWKDYVYSRDIDGLIAETALDWDCPEVAELAARTIGRIRSLYAAHLVADRQKEGQKGALRTLALIRDEVPYLPDAVSAQARLYAWMTNTWRRLSDQPMGVVWRFVLGFLGGFAAMAAYAWINLAGPAVLFNEALGKTISTGITFGVFVGLMVVLAGEVPARLGTFWPLWSCLAVSIGLGILSGALVWAMYFLLLLYLPLQTIEINVLLFGGLGTALGFAFSGTFKLRGWQATLLTMAIIFVTIKFSFDQYWASAPGWTSPVLYFSGPEAVLPQGLLVAALIAICGQARSLWADIRKFFGQLQATRKNTAAA